MCEDVALLKEERAAEAAVRPGVVGERVSDGLLVFGIHAHTVVSVLGELVSGEMGYLLIVIVFVTMTTSSCDDSSDPLKKTGVAMTVTPGRPKFEDVGNRSTYLQYENLAQLNSG